jgi:hypothetical protein
MNLLHSLFTRNLLMSGVAIVRYIPRAFRVKQVDGNLFFTEGKREEYRRRVEARCSRDRLRVAHHLAAQHHRWRTR